MSMLIVILLVITAYVVYYYFERKLSYFKDHGVPSALTWPLLGSMSKVFFRQQHFSDLVIDLYRDFPGVKYIGAFNFMRPVVVVRDLELIKMVTIKHFDNFSDHKSFFDVEDSIPADRWREMTNMLSPAFSSSKLKNMFKLMVECAESYTSYVDDLPRSSRRMMNTKDFFVRYTNDVLAIYAYGVSVESLKDLENEFVPVGNKATNFEGIVTLKYVITRSFSWFMKWFSIRFFDKKTVNFTETIVDTTVRTRDPKGIIRQIMIQLMMDARGKTSDSLKMDLIEKAGNFFFDGFDATSIHMAALAHELAVNHDIQKRLHEEIDEVMERTNGKPTYEDILKMDYLEACFEESIRRHTTAIHLDRVCVKSFELPPSHAGGKPFTLQPGISVWIPTSGIHMDPKIFRNPQQFDPDRYCKRKESVCGVPHLGFGLGPRACIGTKFAIFKMKVLFCYLLSKYNMVPNKKTSIPSELNKASFTIKDVGGFWLAFEARNKKS